MSVSVVSSDMDLFLSLRGSSSKKSVESKGTTSFNALLQQAKEATSTTKAESAPTLEMPFEIQRQAQLPSMMMLAQAGRWDGDTNGPLSALWKITEEYFNDVKEEYGCTDDYKPYLGGLPESDPKIEEAMRLEVRDRLNADPRVPGLVAQAGGIYPIPEKFNPDSTYGTHRMVTLT